MTELLRTPHVVITKDAALPFVRVTRLGAAISSAAEIDAMVRDVARALEPLRRRGITVLCDLRDAPLGVETNFQAPMAAFRAELCRGTHRTAFLVGTVVGLLQARRFLREQGLHAPVFDDEKAAMAHLASPAPAARSESAIGPTSSPGQQRRSRF